MNNRNSEQRATDFSQDGQMGARDGGGPQRVPGRCGCQESGQCPQGAAVPGTSPCSAELAKRCFALEKQLVALQQDEESLKEECEALQARCDDLKQESENWRHQYEEIRGCSFYRASLPLQWVIDHLVYRKRTRSRKSA